MTILNSKLVLAMAASVLLAGCGGGGTSDTVPAEGEVAATLEQSAGEATEAVENAAADVGNAVEQAADTTTAAADSAMDAVDDAGWTTLQDNWEDSIGSIKDRWAELTEEELLLVNGDRDQLVSLVQSKYGMDKDAAESEVDAWASTL